MSTRTQRSLASGEIAPALYPRTDTSKFGSGARRVRNNLIMRHGGTLSRAGTSFVGEVKDSTKTVRLIPFVFNSSQTYVLEFGDLYMRVVKDGAQVTNTAQNITAITNASTGVLTYSGADNFSNGDQVYISGIVGAIGSYLNGRTFKVANVNTGANTFELNYLDGTAVNTTSMGSYTSGGTIAEIYTLTTTYAEADLPALRFAQSADVITITHPSYAPRQLSRSADNSWSIANVSFGPSISAPEATGASSGYGANPETSATSWGVTAVSATGEESYAGGLADGNEPSSGSPQALEWGNVSGAVEYRVYRRKYNLFCFIATVTNFQQPSLLSCEFTDTGLTPDVDENPPTNPQLFGSSNNYPTACAYIQQRLFLGNSNTNTETVWASRIGQPTNFTFKLPLRDDDRLQFNLLGKKVNRIQHLLEVGKPLVFTDNGVYTLEGNDAGTVTPAAVNPKLQSPFGAGTLAPLVVGESALYVQARGKVIRDIGFDFQADGYRGNDLTVFSSHLFDAYTLSDWAYQEIPHSVVWIVRSDGTLLSLTYVREQEILGWAWHDTDGTFENVCCVPEGTEDAVYAVVKRTINGSTKRYIERMNSRQITESTIKDFVGMDCALSVDGRNTGATTMTLSGSGWTYQDTLTLTASASTFASTDIGNEIHLYVVDDDDVITDTIRCSIVEYTSATVVSVMPNKTVPASLRATATTEWAEAVDELSGLWHLEGKDVSIFADGFVVGSPNNSAYTTYTVTNGAITLEKCHAVIHVGLPYTCDLETLDIDSSDGESVANRKTHVSKVTIHCEKTRGVFVGRKAPSDDDDDPLENLYEAKLRENEGYDEPSDLTTGKFEVIIQPGWDSNGRVFIRQVDPAPMSVLAVTPELMVPIRGGG